MKAAPLAFVLIVGLPAVAHALPAPEKAINFNISSEPLTDALTSFALQAGRQIVFSKALVYGRVATPVRGSYKADEALSRLLKGTRITAIATESGYVLVRYKGRPGKGCEPARKKKPMIGRETEMLKSSRIRTLLGAAAGASALGCPAMAQTAPQAESPISATDDGNRVGEIVVTAQRRAENLQKVPITVTAIGEQDLRDRGIAQLVDIATAVPSMSIAKGSGIIQPFLRGVGNISFIPGNESSIGVYIDGVYYTRLPTSLFSLASVDRVEVLKGPQGTLFGRNASGGVIQIVTKEPSHTTSAKAGLSYGRFQTVEGYAYVTTGLSEAIAADIAISGRAMGEGWGVNHTTGGRSFFEDYFTVRSKMLIEPTDRLKLTLSGVYGWNRGSTAANHFPGTTQGYVTAPAALAPTLPFWDNDVDYDNYVLTKTYVGSLHAVMDLSFATLTSITAYSEQHISQPADTDFSSRPDGRAEQHPYVNLFTQELQLASQNDGPLTWVGGLFYYHAKTVSTIELRSPSGLFAGTYAQGLDSIATQNAKSYAAYGQATLEVLKDLKLTGGIRFTHDLTKGSGSTLFGVVARVAQGLPPLQVAPPPATYKRDIVTFRAAVDYQLTEDALIYGSFSRGYKAGIFNLNTFNNIPTKPEIIDAYEVGFKSNLLDRRLRFNAAAWYYDVANPQTQTINPATRTNIFANAKAARTKGVEAELVARVGSNLTLRANAAYTDSKYTDYKDAICTPQNPNPPYGRGAQIQCDASGNYTPRAPKWTTGLGFDYSIPIGEDKLQITADWSHKSSFFFVASNDLRQPAYDVVDARMKYSFNDHVAAIVYGKNLTNAKYALRSQEFSGPNGSPYDPGPRMSYGVGFEFLF